MKINDMVNGWLEYMDPNLLKRYNEQHGSVDVVVANKVHASVKGDPDHAMYLALKGLALLLCGAIIWILFANIHHQRWYLGTLLPLVPVAALVAYMLFVIRPRQEVVSRCGSVLNDFCEVMGRLDRVRVWTSKYDEEWLGNVGVVLAEAVLKSEVEFNRLCGEPANNVKEIVEVGQAVMRNRIEFNEVTGYIKIHFKLEIDRRRVFTAASQNIMDAAAGMK